MRNKLSIYLVAVVLSVAFGGALHAQDHFKVATEQHIDKDIYSAPMSIVKMDVVTMNETSFVVLQNGTQTIIAAVPEMRDQGYRSSLDESRNSQTVPTPKIKQLKARTLIRSILKHPKGSI